MVAKRSDAGENRPRRIDRSPAPAPAPGPGGEPPLSLERIVTTAVDMLDTQGLDGLTMRGLANRLGAGAMSLYWHVANKDAVFDLALDSVLQYGGPPSTIARQDWRGQVVHMLGDWRAGMLRHPGQHLCCRAARSARISSAAWNCWARPCPVPAWPIRI